MRLSFAATLTLAALFSHSQVAFAQSCEAAMLQNMQQMADNALQCGESAELMSSLTSGGSGGIGFDELASSCQQGVDVSSQLDAFNECSRVYVCAVLAYSHAIENLSSYGGDCTAAANAGLSEFPVQ